MRLSALHALKGLHKKLGEDYLNLLPETIPFISELMEGMCYCKCGVCVCVCVWRGRGDMWGCISMMSVYVLICMKKSVCFLA